MRKFVSLILCLSMLSALLCAPASAASHTSTDPTSTYVQLSDGTYLIANDLPDGNAKFSITNSHGDILAESYLDRSSPSTILTYELEIMRLSLSLQKTSYIRLTKRSHPKVQIFQSALPTVAK